MRPARKAKRLAKTVLLVVLTAAMAAAAMVPALDRGVGRTTATELAAAIEEHLADFPPPAPASYVGDHYYQWSTMACPNGAYTAPASERRPELTSPTAVAD